jgi:hypothetical protein
MLTLTSFQWDSDLSRRYVDRPNQPATVAAPKSTKTLPQYIRIFAPLDHKFEVDFAGLIAPDLLRTLQKVRYEKASFHPRYDDLP